MTPADRVAKLLRETRGQPSEGDLRQMVEDVRLDVVESAAEILIASWCDEFGGMTREQAENTSEVILVRALARERSR